MKTRNLLIAALLLGGMTAFNACSDKDAIDEIVPPVDQPAEELETVFMMNAGYGDNIETRADLNNPSNSDSDYENVYNYALAIFEADGSGDDGIATAEELSGKKILAYYAVKSEEPIWSPEERNTSMDEKDGYHQVHHGDKFGFYLMPQRFKTSAKHVAVVVVANSSVLNETQEKPANINTFKEYVEYINTSVFPMPDQDQQNGVTYPMSSNVCVVSIKPGAYNAIGLGSSQGSFGMEKAQSVLNSWESSITLTSENFNPTIEQRILLYRCWSQIELSEIAVKSSNKSATDARFTLKRAFLMNVPVNSRIFDETKIVSGAGRSQLTKWTSWGGALHMEGLSDLSSVKFYSGYSSDKSNNDKESSESLEGKGENVYDTYFRDQIIANATTYAEGYDRDLSALGSTLGVAQQTNNKLISSNSDIYDIEHFPGKNFSFIVNSGDYGVSYKPQTLDADYDSEKAIVLCVKGDYEELVNNVWVTYTDRYYTVVVNDGGTVENNGILSQEENIANTVVRNVKYDISLTVTGPGSDSAVGHMPYTYVVPKVTIVPFGHVTQKSEVD